MEFIYSRNEIWKKYPRANTIVLSWCYLIAISNYISYFSNIIYFYIIKNNNCVNQSTEDIWQAICLMFAVVYCCLSHNIINKFTLIPNRMYNIKIYLFNFTILYLFSFTNIYITLCYSSQSDAIMCKTIQMCKDNYIVFVISTNLYFLWMNTVLLHIILTWLLHVAQTNVRITNLNNLRIDHTDQEIECVICFELLRENSVVRTPCNHYFHNNCLLEWVIINNTCPVCRINFGDIV